MAVTYTPEDFPDLKDIIAVVYALVHAEDKVHKLMNYHTALHRMLRKYPEAKDDFSLLSGHLADLIAMYREQAIHEARHTPPAVTRLKKGRPQKVIVKSVEQMEVGTRSIASKVIDSDRDYSIQEAAELLHLSVNTMYDYNRRRLIPHTTGRPVTYKGADLCTFIENRRIDNVSAGPSEEVSVPYKKGVNQKFRHHSGGKLKDIEKEMRERGLLK